MKICSVKADKGGLSVGLVPEGTLEKYLMAGGEVTASNSLGILWLHFKIGGSAEEEDAPAIPEHRGGGRERWERSRIIGIGPGKGIRGGGRIREAGSEFDGGMH